MTGFSRERKAFKNQTTTWRLAPRELSESWLDAGYADTKFWIHLSSNGCCHTASNYFKLGIQFPQNCLGSARPSVNAGALSARKKVAIRKLQLNVASRELEASSYSTMT